MMDDTDVCRDEVEWMWPFHVRYHSPTQEPFEYVTLGFPAIYITCPDFPQAPIQATNESKCLPTPDCLFAFMTTVESGSVC